MEKWISDQSDGTFVNPILYADYSDPDAIRVGEDYFMTASSFCNTPGLPILHSRDLVNWKVIGYALKNIPYERYETPQHGCGVWAPAIRYHEGEFIIFFPMPDEGIFVVKTKDPWGEWSQPHAIFEGKGWIDPCPFWDEDGRAYMVSGVARSRIGYKSVLHVTEMTPDCDHLLEKEHRVFDGSACGQETIEGPKLYKRNGYYYIFAPAGGVKQGWQTVLRSKNIYGPYEFRKVCEQKDTMVNGPHQGAYVDTPEGEDWFLHFQDVYAAGRIVHLQRLRWVDDWPVIGEAGEGESCGKPMMVCRKPKTAEAAGKSAGETVFAPDASDEFDGDSLSLQWQWNANHHKEWYSCEGRNSCIRLNSVKMADSISNQPNLLLQKWHAPEFTAEARLDVENLEDGDLAGLINMGVIYGALAVYRERDRYGLVILQGEQKFEKEQAAALDREQVIVPELKFTGTGKRIYFRYHVCRVPSTRYNTDGIFRFGIPREQVVLSYSMDGMNFIPALSLEPSAGRWVGVKEGLFICNRKNRSGGFVRADYFRMS